MDPAVLLVTSNGAGLGHLARMAAVADVLAARGARPVLVSMSAALPLVTAATGLPGEYVPGPHRGWVGPARWQRYFADRLVALAREVEARALVYDGVAPYAGLLIARAALPDVPFVWSRRGLWRPGTNRRALWTAPAFDLVIEPGDVAADADVGPTSGRTDALRVPPVSLAGVLDPLPRDEARRRLGLHPERPAALVTLGTAVRGDLSGPGAAAARAVLSGPDWQLAVTSVALGATPAAVGDDHRVVTLSGVFPLVPLLPAFDAAVAGAGYNAVHELLPAGVPTLLVTKHTGTDDQEARARYAERRGWALTATQDDSAAVGRATVRLLQEQTRAQLASGVADVPPVDGAVAFAEAVLSIADRPGEHRTRPAERAARAQLVARSAVRARLPAGRAAGAPPRWTTRVGHAELLDDEPVEQLLPGSSPGYRQSRERIAVRAYGERRQSPAGPRRVDDRGT